MVRQLEVRTYDVVLATHEQAWLLGASRYLLLADLPVAGASNAAFHRVRAS
jgi:hypothetical protein